jgi:hypothetical protein
MATKTDEQVQLLFNVVQQKKAEIAKIEKPNWKTNSSFRWDENNPSTSFNIQVVAEAKILVNALAKLNSMCVESEKAALELGVENYKFEYLGFSLGEWKSDFKTRVDKINITKKKNELNALEARLNSLISPELRNQMELEAIQKELGL